jgi:hypothetical protein
MSSQYPVVIDSSITLPPANDNSSAVDATKFNQLRDAVINIEAELGIKPSGTYGTVKERLDQLVLGSGGGGGGGGGGTTITLPASTAPNAVLQRSYPPGTDPVFFAPLTLDQILPSFVVSLALVGSGFVEAGQTVSTPAFTASYNRTPLTTTLTDTVPTAPKNVSSTPTSFSSNGTFIRGYGSSVTFTLSANEAGGPNRTSSASISWGQKVYWGNAVPGTFNATFITSLPGNALSLALGRTFTSTAGLSEKLYYAFRSAYGTPTFTVGGFVGGFHIAGSSIAITNAQGVTENYNIWESDNFNLGTTIIGVS